MTKPPPDPDRVEIDESVSLDEVARALLGSKPMHKHTVPKPGKAPD